MQLDLLTSSCLVAPAKVLASQENASDWMMRVVTWRSSAARLFTENVRVGSSLRTSLASSLLILDGTSGRSLPPSLDTHQAQLFDPQPMDGAMPDMSSRLRVDMDLPGECWTHNSSEWTGLDGLGLNDEGVCSLSDILETGDVPQQYYLSSKACRGILRRAEARGKKLPAQLQQALGAVAGSEKASAGS